MSRQVRKIQRRKMETYQNAGIQQLFNRVEVMERQLLAADAYMNNLENKLVEAGVLSREAIDKIAGDAARAALDATQPPTQPQPVVAEVK